MATAEELESMRTQLAQLQDRNDALQASMENIQQKQLEEKEESHHGEMDDPEPQPLQTTPSLRLRREERPYGARYSFQHSHVCSRSP
jgi:hypothetical protein